MLDYSTFEGLVEASVGQSTAGAALSKYCTGCSTVLPLTAFYARASKCKECTKAAVRANRLAKLDQYKEYERSRAMLPHRVEARKEYIQSDAGKAASDKAKRAYAERNQDKVMAAKRAYAERDQDKVRAAKRKYAASEAGRLKRAAYLATESGAIARAVGTRNYRERNPAKQLAHEAVAYALKVGKLQRLPCECCGDPKTEAHHVHYDMPLVVVWLCFRHHKQVHNEHREMQRATVSTS